MTDTGNVKANLICGSGDESENAGLAKPETPIRNAFDRYMFEGGFEATAKKAVAEARANLIAHGITPADSSNVKPSASIRKIVPK